MEQQYDGMTTEQKKKIVSREMKGYIFCLPGRCIVTILKRIFSVCLITVGEHFEYNNMIDKRIRSK